MKSQPFMHQQEGFRRLAARPRFYAIGCEQGTGKTWMLLADAEAQFLDGRITGLLVVAPKGVHTNWVRREIPKHLSCKVRSAYWLSGAGVRHMRTVEKVMQPDPERLCVFTVNVDAMNTPKGRAAVGKFLDNHRAMMVVDESQRIKSPKAGRAKHTVRLGRKAVSRRISSGTLVPNSPPDLWMQYEFLSPGLLGKSYRAFVAEFCELLPPTSSLVEDIAARSRYKDADPQVIRRDSKGRPMYRNLDKLREMIAPHTYRVLKRDCLDLPEKVYQTIDFELTPSRRKLYEFVKANLRIELQGGEIETFTALTALNKLRQITSGFVMLPDGTLRFEESERLGALVNLLEDLEGKVIIWGSYREELAMIAGAVRDLGRAVEYHGGISAADREAAVDEFQTGDARFFVANPQAGGTGLTLTAATTAVYFSNSFNFEERTQSEDRCHRIGTTGKVTYIDLVASETIDERIAAALQAKEAVAATILDGPMPDWQPDFEPSEILGQELAR
jgi:SNF2 family DNA or RNA helicase